MQVKHKVMSEGVLAWIGEQGLEAELGGPKGVLSMVLRALLVAGAKSFTHMITALERYCLVLQTLLAQTGAEVCWLEHLSATVLKLKLLALMRAWLQCCSACRDMQKLMWSRESGSALFNH